MNPAASSAKLRMECAYKISGNQRMPPARPGHRKHLAIVVLALVLGSALDGEILLRGQSVFGLGLHDNTTSLSLINELRLLERQFDIGEADRQVFIDDD